MPDNQFIEVSYGNVTLAAPAPKPPSKPRRERFVEWLVFLRSLTINVVVIGSIIAVLAVTARDLFRQPVIIEEIGLPKALTDRGYSGTVAAHRLWDAIQNIQDNSGTAKPQTTLLTSSRQLDVVEPGTGISLQGLTQMLRAVFGLKQTRIAGEVICLDPDCSAKSLALRLRVLTGDGMEVVSAGPVGNQTIEAYFNRSALMLLEEIDPYVVAAYHYDRPDNQEQSIIIARNLVARDHKHAAWAANMIANHEQESGKFNDAVLWYKRSIKLAEDSKMTGFALPWYGWGNLLRSNGVLDEAIDKYARAAEVDPHFALSWYNLGVTLGDLGDHQQAIDKFSRATDENPNFSSAWLGWGVSLAKLGRHEEAVEKFRRATQEDSDSASAWLAWGETPKTL